MVEHRVALCKLFKKKVNIFKMFGMYRKILIYGNIPPKNIINGHMMNVQFLSIRSRLEEEKSQMMSTTQQMALKTASLERQLEESKEALAQLKAEEETERIQRKEVIIEILSAHLRSWYKNLKR